MKFAPVSCAAGLLLLLLSAEAASAAPTLVTANVNMRAGPGTTFEVITLIPGGSTVDVTRCSGGWCSVVWQGRAGYAIATNLGMGGRPAGASGPVEVAGVYGPPAYGPPAYVVTPAPYYYPYYYRPYGWGWGGGWRGGWRRW